MNGSYKCAQCGMVNWTIDDFCKRCGVPNPFTSAATQANNFQTAPAPNNVQAFSQSAPPPNAFSQSASPAPPVRAMPDFASPPPPNVFGRGVGTVESFNDGAPNNFENRPPIRGYNRQASSPEFEEKLKKANKEIRDAWISGVVVCTITLLFAVIRLGMSASPAEPIAMIFSVIIYGGLTVGVFYKNRACAVLLFGLFVLDKILMVAQGNASGIIIGLILIYYFAMGIQGTFAYHKLKKSNR
jgi:hypothetical protein